MFSGAKKTLYLFAWIIIIISIILIPAFGANSSIKNIVPISNVNTFITE
jgi:hypothetical protein